MLIGDIPPGELVRRLRTEGVHLRTGAFSIELHIRFAALVAEFAAMYSDYPIDEPPGIDDAVVDIGPLSWWRRYWRPMAVARSDGVAFIEPVPLERAFALLESSLNWTVAMSRVAPVIMHAAALERNGRALLMPAPSGSGKSTLTAALSWRGWRLFSDEMAVFRFDDLALLPNPRPVSLKNAAIDVIRRFESRAVISPVYRGTPKGDVAYMRAPTAAVSRAEESAPVGWVVIPEWRAGAEASLRQLRRTEAFRWLLESTVNYASTLNYGFELLSGIVENCPVYLLTYSDLHAAIDLLNGIADGEMAPHGG